MQIYSTYTYSCHISIRTYEFVSKNDRITKKRCVGFIWRKRSIYWAFHGRGPFEELGGVALSDSLDLSIDPFSSKKVGCTAVVAPVILAQLKGWSVIQKVSSSLGSIAIHLGLSWEDEDKYVPRKREMSNYFKANTCELWRDWMKVEKVDSRIILKTKQMVENHYFPYVIGWIERVPMIPYSFRKGYEQWYLKCWCMFKTSPETNMLGKCMKIQLGKLFLSCEARLLL